MRVRITVCWAMALTALLLLSYGGFRAIECRYRDIANLSARFRTAGVLVNGTEFVIPLTTDTLVAQSFRADFDRLAALEIFPNAWVEPQQRQTGRWALYEVGDEDASKTLVRDGTYIVKHSEAARPLKLRFHPITSSAGRRYELLLHAPERPPSGNIGLLAFNLHPREQTLQTLQIIDGPEAPTVAEPAADESSSGTLGLNLKFYYLRAEN